MGFMLSLDGSPSFWREGRCLLDRETNICDAPIGAADLPNASGERQGNVLGKKSARQNPKPTQRRKNMAAKKTKAKKPRAKKAPVKKVPAKKAPVKKAVVAKPVKQKAKKPAPKKVAKPVVKAAKAPVAPPRTRCAGCTGTSASSNTRTQCARSVGRAGQSLISCAPSGCAGH